MNSQLRILRYMCLVSLLWLTALAACADALAGEYIGAVPGDGRSPLLRRQFTVDRLKGRALLRVNSLGYHEAYINGVKVGDGVLMPAVSQLNKRSLIVTYDVTKMLRRGSNEIMLWTGSGWYKPATFGAVYNGPLVKAELVEEHSSKKCDHKLLLCTDGSWEGAWSGYCDLGTWAPHGFGGERIDARVMPQWQPVDVVKVEGVEATEMACEPCRVQEELSPVSIVADGEGRWVVDFGRVVNGLLDISLPALPEGHTTTASFSDVRRDDGSFSMASRNVYISSGRKEVDRFTNRFNHHVFRYVVIDSLPVMPRKEDIKALRMRTDYRRTATFQSSDDELNSIHDMVAYTLENLAFDGYMVDCANFERLGYGGDGNASTLTLQILFDVERLYDNWLMAWRDVIHDDGALPHTAPAPYKAGGGPYWCSFIVQAPWRTYMSYGNVEVLRQNYPAMKRWLEYVDRYTVDGLLKKWPEMNDRWWYLGDWAAPDGVDVMSEESIDLVNNCAMCQVYLQLEQIARVLGREADAMDYRQRYDRLAAVVNDCLYHAEQGIYGTGSQVDMVYPMLVGIVPDSLKTSVRDQLIARTREVYNSHLTTGLVGVPVLTEWATLNGEADWMYGMLKQHSYPGYLYMIDNGATATWEHWDGRRSFMHNCFNGIGSWFYQALGGIVPLEPGYGRVRIEPQMPKGLEWVKVTQETRHGKITVERHGNQLRVEIPKGITAVIKGKEYTAGKKHRIRTTL